MTSITKTINTSHSDAQKAPLTTSRTGLFLAEKFPLAAAIPSLVLAAARDIGKTPSGDGIVKAARVFFKQINPKVIFGTVLLVGWVLYKLALLWAAYKDKIQKQAREMLFKKLNNAYEIAGNGQPVQSYLELKSRITKAMELILQGLTEEERIVFNRFGTSKAQLIKEAKIALFMEKSPHLNLTPAYEEIVRRSSPKERKALETKLYSLPKPEENIHNLLKALEKGDWDAAIFQNEEFPYYALEAVRRGQLSPHDYATVLTFWEMIQLHPDPSTRKTIPIFNPDGTVNEIAKAHIIKTLVYNKKATDKPCALSSDQIDQLFKKIKKLPPSQQHIWTVPQINEPIIKAISVPILAEINPDGMLVAPVGMMQAFLDVAFGDNAVKLNPVHGISSWNDLRQNHFKGERDYAIHFPGIELPEDADDRKARWFYFGKHDFYHAVLISSIPKAYRKCYVECYDIIQRSYPTVDPDKGSTFIDMEALNFIENFASKKESAQNVFWIELIESIQQSALNESVQEHRQKKRPLASIAELHRKEIIYATLIASHLSPIPEIQNGPRALFQSMKAKYGLNERDFYSGSHRLAILDTLVKNWRTDLCEPA